MLKSTKKLNKLQEEIEALSYSVLKKEKSRKYSKAPTNLDHENSLTVERAEHLKNEDSKIIEHEEDSDGEGDNDHNDSHSQKSNMSRCSSMRDIDLKKGSQNDGHQSRAYSRFSTNRGDEKRNTITSETNPDNVTDPREKLRLVEMEPDWIEIVRLTNGDSFGELALINNSPRAATVVCETE